MAAPRCRSCCIAPTPRRSPNRATYLAFYVDGLATLLCTLHTDMCLRGGGFAVSLKLVPAIFDEALDKQAVANMIQTAGVAHNARARAWSALYEPEPLALEESAGVQGVRPPGGAQPPVEVP